MNKMCIPMLNEKKFTLTKMYDNDYAIHLKESIITEPIILNQEAKTIFSYIDGKNSVDAIISHVMLDYNISEEDRIYKDVEKELEILWGLKILDFVGEDPFQKSVERDIEKYKISYIREIQENAIDANCDYVYGFWNKNIDYTTTMLNSSDEAGALKMFQFKQDEKCLMTIGISYSWSINIFEIKFIHLDENEIGNITNFIDQILAFIKDFYFGNKRRLLDINVTCFLAYVDSLDSKSKDTLKMLCFSKCGQLKKELEDSNMDLYLYYVN